MPVTDGDVTQPLVFGGGRKGMTSALEGGVTWQRVGGAVTVGAGEVIAPPHRQEDSNCR